MQVGTPDISGGEGKVKWDAGWAAEDWTDEKLKLGTSMKDLGNIFCKDMVNGEK